MSEKLKPLGARGADEDCQKTKSSPEASEIVFPISVILAFLFLQIKPMKSGGSRINRRDHCMPPSLKGVHCVWVGRQHRLSVLSWESVGLQNTWQFRKSRRSDVTDLSSLGQ